MAINKKLLRKIRDHILETPKHMNMILFAGDTTNCDINYAEAKKYTCNSVGCIAGWACFLGPKTIGTVPYWEIEDKAEELLQLAPQADWAVPSMGGKLFYVEGWPLKFKKRLLNDPEGDWGDPENLKFKPGSKRYAKVVADRIDHFIETKGAE